MTATNQSTVGFFSADFLLSQLSLIHHRVPIGLLVVRIRVERVVELQAGRALLVQREEHAAGNLLCRARARPQAHLVQLAVPVLHVGVGVVVARNAKRRLGAVLAAALRPHVARHGHAVDVQHSLARVRSGNGIHGNGNVHPLASVKSWLARIFLVFTV